MKFMEESEHNLVIKYGIEGAWYLGNREYLSYEAKKLGILDVREYSWLWSMEFREYLSNEVHGRKGAWQ